MLQSEKVIGERQLKSTASILVGTYRKTIDLLRKRQMVRDVVPGRARVRFALVAR